MAELNSKHAAMKHIFLLWQRLARQKIEKKKCHALASKIHELSTYNETWQRWNQHLKMRKKMRCMRKQAKAIHQLTTLKQSFQSWMAQYKYVKTNRVRSKQLGLLRRRNLLTFYFLAWKQYSRDFHLEASRTTQLKKIRTNVQCRKVIMVWKSVLAERNKQQELVKKALELRIMEIFNAWYRELNMNKYKKKRISEFMQMRNFNLCKACFEWWKNYLIMQFQENAKIKKLSSQYRRMKLRSYFLVWKQLEREKHFKRQALDGKRREVNKIFVRHLFEFWIEKTRNVRILNQKIYKMREVFNNALLMKYLYHWIHYSKLKSLRQQTAVTVRTYVNKLELKIYFTSWQEKLVIQYRNKDKTAQALIHWSRTLTKKTFLDWIRYTKCKKLRKQRYWQAMEQHKSFVLKQGLRTFLIKGAQELVQKNEEAMENSRQKENILLKFFTRWKNCVRFRDRDEFVRKTFASRLTQGKRLTSENSRLSKLPGSALHRSVGFTSMPRKEPKIPEFLMFMNN